MIQIVHSDKAPQAIGPYSQAVIANGFVFCSGQVARVPGTKIISEDIQLQTKQVMENLAAVLEAAGTDLEHVVKTTIFVVNMSDYAKVNEIYAQFFLNHKPARATVEVSKLPQGDLPTPPLVEIEAIATLP